MEERGNSLEAVFVRGGAGLCRLDQIGSCCSFISGGKGTKLCRGHACECLIFLYVRHDIRQPFFPFRTTGQLVSRILRSTALHYPCQITRIRLRGKDGPGRFQILLQIQISLGTKYDSEHRTPYLPLKTHRASMSRRRGKYRPTVWNFVHRMDQANKVISWTSGKSSMDLRILQLLNTCGWLYRLTSDLGGQDRREETNQ